MEVVLINFVYIGPNTHFGKQSPVTASDWEPMQPIFRPGSLDQTLAIPVSSFDGRSAQTDRVRTIDDAPNARLGS